MLPALVGVATAVGTPRRAHGQPRPGVSSARLACERALAAAAPALHVGRLRFAPDTVLPASQRLRGSANGGTGTMFARGTLAQPHQRTRDVLLVAGYFARPDDDRTGCRVETFEPLAPSDRVAVGPFGSPASDAVAAWHPRGQFPGWIDALVLTDAAGEIVAARFYNAQIRVRTLAPPPGTAPGPLFVVESTTGASEDATVTAYALIENELRAVVDPIAAGEHAMSPCQDALPGGGAGVCERGPPGGLVATSGGALEAWREHPATDDAHAGGVEARALVWDAGAMRFVARGPARRETPVLRWHRRETPGR